MTRKVLVCHPTAPIYSVSDWQPIKPKMQNFELTQRCVENFHVLRCHELTDQRRFADARVAKKNDTVFSDIFFFSLARRHVIVAAATAGTIERTSFAST